MPVALPNHRIYRRMSVLPPRTAPAEWVGSGGLQSLPRVSKLFTLPADLSTFTGTLFYQPRNFKLG